MSRSVHGNIDRLAPQHSGSTAYINARIIDPVGDAEYRGAVLISDPVEVPFRVGSLGRKRLCYFHDPDGVVLEVAAYG